MERRDFFGILAAPLLRRFTPPAPVAKAGSITFPELSTAEAFGQLSRSCGFSVTVKDDHLIFERFNQLVIDATDRAILRNYGELTIDSQGLHGPAMRPKV
jgi:hypothetical protein